MPRINQLRMAARCQGPCTLCRDSDTYVEELDDKAPAAGGELAVREFDGNGSSSALPLKAPEIPERTLAQRQQDVVAEIQRQLNLADHQLESVQRARDLRAWEASYTRLEQEIATSAEALENARQLQIDADTLTAWQTGITALRREAAAVRPPRQPELALESEIEATKSMLPSAMVPR